MEQLLLWALLLGLLGFVCFFSGRQNRPMRTGRPFPVRVVAVQDGDSLIVRVAHSRYDEQYRIRLYAIDAPEHDQEYGREARDYLRRLVWNRTDLMLEPVDTDQYGRLVGVLYYRAMDRRRSINRLMVEQGLAYWYSRFGGHELGLEQAEENARRRRRGVWASGGQVAPWEHRRSQREAANQMGCLKWILAGAMVGAIIGVALLWLIFD